MTFTRLKAIAKKAYPAGNMHIYFIDTRLPANSATMAYRSDLLKKFNMNRIDHLRQPNSPLKFQGTIYASDKPMKMHSRQSAEKSDSPGKDGLLAIVPQHFHDLKLGSPEPLNRMGTAKRAFRRSDVPGLLRDRSDLVLFADQLYAPYGKVKIQQIWRNYTWAAVVNNALKPETQGEFFCE